MNEGQLMVTMMDYVVVITNHKRHMDICDNLPDWIVVRFKSHPTPNQWKCPLKAPIP